METKREGHDAPNAAAVALRPLEEADAVRILAWVSDPAIRRNLGLRNAPSMERTIDWIRRAQTDQSLFARAIVFDGEHVGNAALDQLDPLTHTARISLYLGTTAPGGRGIGQTAMRLCIQQGAPLLGVQKIWGHVAVDNVRSIRMLIATGYVMEGLLRRQFYTDEGIIDCYAVAFFV